ncbi:MAG UNVERIFIED_CONTAM: hypothetical protein LVR18_28745 [Planctomycetaceae bacterium]|jgi:hypothetical protein
MLLELLDRIIDDLQLFCGSLHQQPHKGKGEYLWEAAGDCSRDLPTGSVLTSDYRKTCTENPVECSLTCRWRMKAKIP